MNKKHILVISGIIIGLVCIFVILKIQMSPIPYNDQPPFPSIVPSLYTSDTVNFTGANETPPSNQVGISQAYELRKKLPITTEIFDISYDYTQAKFSVVMKTANQDDVAKFHQWRKENYPEIVETEFTIIEKK